MLGSQHTSSGDLVRRIRNLERKVQQLQTSRRLESATIAQGGLTVKDGGELRVVGEDGQPRLLVRDGEIVVQAGGQIRSQDFVAGEAGYRLGDDIEANEATFREGIILPEALSSRTHVGLTIHEEADSEIGATASPSQTATFTVAIPDWVESGTILLIVDGSIARHPSDDDTIDYFAALKAWLPDYLTDPEDILGITGLKLPSDSITSDVDSTLAVPFQIPERLGTSDVPSSLDITVSLQPVGAATTWWRWIASAQLIGTN